MKLFLYHEAIFQARGMFYGYIVHDRSEILEGGLWGIADRLYSQLEVFRLYKKNILPWFLVFKYMLKLLDT